MQDTAEQVLARLERYVATVPAPRPEPVAAPPLYRPGMPFSLTQPDVSTTAFPGVAAADTLMPTRGAPPAAGTWFLPVALAITLAAAACALAIALFVVLDPGAAIVAVLVLMLAAVIARRQRVPLATAPTIGLVVAVLIVRGS